MIGIRRSEERGTARHGWLSSRHTFSFGQYHDPRYMGFGPLRVINEDRVQPGQGFATHGHRDMEIISYVLDGALEHKDSLGNGTVIRPGDVQRMTAGTGVTHSEFNPSATEPVHFLQIWILPGEAGLEPGYEQKTFGEAEKRGVLRLVGSRQGRDGSVTIHQDTDLYVTCPEDGQEILHGLAAGRKAWVQVVRGRGEVNGRELQAGDGVALADEPMLRLRGVSGAEMLLFDMGR